jgi:FdhD protein
MSRAPADTSEATSRVNVTRIGEDARRFEDLVAVEEPLEIRLGYSSGGRRERKSISITMRTPGHDFDLALGFLFSEQIITSREQIANVRHCGPASREQHCNTVLVELAEGVGVDLQRLERHFYTTSSCGVCGKSSIEALQLRNSPPDPTASRPIDPQVLVRLPERMRTAQQGFESTGGLHAAALFTFGGELVEVREDVGRHNAVDKVVGASIAARRLPLSDHILMVSGRASFELVQKALVAGIPMLAAIGSPSSLAIELADSFGMTIVGFLRPDRFNVYSGAQRIAG